MSAHPESELQQACVHEFRTKYRTLAALLNSVPNGARVSRSQAQVLKAEGLTAGVADLELNIARGPWHGLKIEMKTESEEWHKGKRTLTRTYQSPKQREWQAAVEAQGYRYAVCRTLDEFMDTIYSYLQYDETDD